MTPQERAARFSDAEVRTGWRRATVEGRVEPFADVGLTVEAALEETGFEVLARFSCAEPVLYVAQDDDALIVVADDGDGPAAIMLEDGPIVAGLKAAAAEVLDALFDAVEPHDEATREAATKAEHVLGFALDDLRRLTGGPPPV